MKKPDIRPTTRADLADLHIVLDETGLFPAEMLAEMLDAPEGGFWLTACHEGRAVALCFARPEPLTDGVWNMLALGVRAPLQGQGIGTALVTAVETRLRSAAARLVLVETSGSADFAQARGFYAARGYAREALIRDYWAPGEDKVIFRKALG